MERRSLDDRRAAVERFERAVELPLLLLAVLMGPLIVVLAGPRSSVHPL